MQKIQEMLVTIQAFKQNAKQMDPFYLARKQKLQRCWKNIEYIRQNILESKPTATPMETNFLNSGMDDSTKLQNNSQYRKAIGSLLYIATVSRPDIALTVA